MSKVTIDGQDFELVPSQIEPDGTFTLRPFKPIEPEEEVGNYRLVFRDYARFNDNYFVEDYNLTPNEAKAVAKFLKVAMEFLMGDVIHYEYEGDEARKLIQKRKAS